MLTDLKHENMLTDVKHNCCFVILARNNNLVSGSS